MKGLSMSSPPVKERPINLSAEEVRGVLAGTLTTLRRAVKPQPVGHDTILDGPLGFIVGQMRDSENAWRTLTCPLGCVGDRLWAITICPVAGYEDRYGIGDDGIVYRIDCGVPKPMRGTPNAKGYLTISLCRNGQKATKAVHRLVFYAFYGRQVSKGEVRHLDSQKTNNHPENLDWGTGAENWTDRKAKKHGMAEDHHSAKLTTSAVAEIRCSRLPQRTLARRYGVAQSTISEVKNGNTWAEEIAAVPANLPRWASRLSLEITEVRVEKNDAGVWEWVVEFKRIEKPEAT